MLGKGDILGNPYLGVFCSANENLAVVPISSPPELPVGYNPTLSIIASLSILAIISILKKKR